MAHEKEVYYIIQHLVASDTKTIASICSSPAYGFWAEGQSAIVQTQKTFKTLEQQNKVVNHGGWWSLPEYRGEYKSHYAKGTETLAEFLKLKGFKVLIKREYPFSNSMRSDGIVMIIQEVKMAGLVILVEICNTESDDFFASKVSELKRNSELIKRELTDCFKIIIPHFVLAVEGKQVEGVVQVKKLIQILKEGK